MAETYTSRHSEHIACANRSSHLELPLHARCAPTGLSRVPDRGTLSLRTTPPRRSLGRAPQIRQLVALAWSPAPAPPARQASGLDPQHGCHVT